MKIVNDIFLKNCIRLLKKFPGEWDKLSPEMEELLCKGIVDVNGCYFFKSVLEEFPDFNVPNVECTTNTEKTYYEIGHNELYLMDYGFPYSGKNTRTTASRVLEIGIISSYRLVSLLKKNGLFCVLFTFNYDVETKVISSFISFNKIRDQESHWYEIENNKLQGVMMIITDQ